MSDIKLFRITNNSTEEIQGKKSDLEKPLQNLIEANLESLLGIRFVATEHSTGATHAGRIDTLGLDEDNSPVIIEYKRSSHENIINQGLYYFTWLMDHQAEFKLLVLEKYGKAVADAIDWTSPRLVCIAADFTKYDEHAVQQMGRNIELIRYRLFGQDLLLFELVHGATSISASSLIRPVRPGGSDKTASDWIAEMSPAMRDLFESVVGFILSLGDDVQRKDQSLYIAFKRLRNFASIVFRKSNLLLFLKMDPSIVELSEGFSRDVSQIGHWGTGDLEITIKNLADLDRAKSLISRAYEGGPNAG